jgi:isopentenyl-diphosphate delta-isomerase
VVTRSELPEVEDTPLRAAGRKQDHIEICARASVESTAQRDAHFYLAPDALPDFSPDSIETSQTFLGQKFALPLLITGMTGGVQEGQRVNEVLAQAAQRWGIPIGLGSQKLMIKEPSYKKLFDVRQAAPRAFVIGNIGLVSFNYGVSVDDVRRMVDELELNACAVHLNVLQEQIQPEGERNFANLLPILESLVRLLPVPVLVKEVGSGIGPETCRRLFETGVQSVDVGGHGGTSWSVIEGLRGDTVTRRLGELFRNWGLSTAESVQECVPVARAFGSSPERSIVATGGIRDGLRVALMLALGARMCGVGLPLFRAVVNPPEGLKSEEALEQELQFLARSLRIAMYCSGARRLEDLSVRLRRRSAT